MYQIGLFSRMNQVTVKTLHHYDEIGLLKPAKIDENTGYRYYDSGQSYILHRINSLKQMGFSLEEVKTIIDGQSKNRLLLHKKAQLLKDIAEKTASLAQVEYYLGNEENEDNDGYEVVIKELPEVMVVFQRVTLSSYEELFHIMPAMGANMQELGCICAKPEYCFNIYLDGEYKDRDIEVEICESVTELKPDALGLKFKLIPGVKKAACLFHRGPYKDFPKAYLALIKWMENNGYKPADFPRESYIDGIWNREKEKDWLTEIQFPIR